jgi:hypothetical protein
MKRWQLFGGRALVSAVRRAKAEEWTHRYLTKLLVVSEKAVARVSQGSNLA